MGKQNIANRFVSRNTVKYAAGLVVALAGIIAIAAARSGSGRHEPVATSRDDIPHHGGRLVIAGNSLPTSLDPLGTHDRQESIIPVLQIYDQLVRADKAGKGVEPDLAQSWDISADGRVYRFHLRPNLKFSDGSPLRASDVKFSLERRAREDMGLSHDLFPPLEITVPDDQTVIITLQEPWAPLLADLAMYAASIIPEAYYTSVGREGFAKKPVGSGPFVVADWKINERFVLTRNRHYWDARYPYLDEVQQIVVENEMNRIMKLKRGEVDIAKLIPFNQISTLKSTEGLSVQVDPIMIVTLITLNQRVPAFENVKVRQAMQWAINREEFIRGVYVGHAEVPRSFLPRVLYTDFDAPPFGYDPEKAKALLAESPFSNGFSVKLAILNNDTAKNTAAVIQNDLKKIGIHLEIQILEGALFWTRCEQGENDLCLIQVASDIADPSEMVSYNAASTGTLPKSVGYKNAEVDALAVEAQREVNPERRAQLYRKIQQIVRDDAPYVWLCWTSAPTAMHSNVHDFSVLPTVNMRLWEVWKSP